MPFPPLKFEKDTLKLLDQRLLPTKETWVTCRNSKQVFDAIRTMIVRGAPAIGITGGYGLYLGIKGYKGTPQGFFKKLEQEAEYLKTSRPTAVNLARIIDDIVETVWKSPDKRTDYLKKLVLKEAQLAHKVDEELCKTIGCEGEVLFKNGDTVLTHCNAGGLATTGYGTALAPIYSAVESGKKIAVFADETRPLLQGARLTAWELTESGIPCTLICDNMAASLMAKGKIDRVIVGADRIASNGDTANKIGTYNVAVLAKAHNIPFYVAAPGTTFDFNIKSGEQIPIEERGASEVTEGFGKRTAPKKVKVYNPAFDVTPHKLITAFVTEAGVLRPPFAKSLKKLNR